MMRAWGERLRQGHRTMAYPDGPLPVLPERFRGRPVIDSDLCDPQRDGQGCQRCADVCPTQAISLRETFTVDLGRCLFCTECAESCPAGAVRYSRDHRLAAATRDALYVASGTELQLAEALGGKLRTLLGRSLKLRQVSAGGCNGCEADVNVLGTIGWDLSRFGVQFVASPRHADGVLVTGCVSENMRIALKKTYDAVPPPKIVIAVGACAISGGPFLFNPEQHGGAASVVPVDLFIPGCPPHPLTILDGLLRLLGRTVPAAAAERSA